jgi:hypothetical protein
MSFPALKKPIDAVRRLTHVVSQCCGTKASSSPLDTPQGPGGVIFSPKAKG